MNVTCSWLKIFVKNFIFLTILFLCIDYSVIVPTLKILSGEALSLNLSWFLSDICIAFIASALLTKEK